MKVIPLVISGGIGSRLWPASRKLYPKPFIKLNDEHTIIRQTYERILKLNDVSRIYTVTNDALYHITQKEFELCETDVEHIIITEPYARNTAAAIGLASNIILDKEGKDSIILVIPADHLILSIEQFTNDINKAVKLVEDNGSLVVFGVQPDHPNTGYGYIQNQGNNVLFFHEKPSEELAKFYIKEGYLWNAGIFCFKASKILDIFEELKPEILGTLRNLNYSYFNNQICINNVDEYNLIESISFDHAIVEKVSNIQVVSCSFSWSDIGTWNSFSEFYKADENGNVFLSSAVSVDTKNTFVKSDNNKVVATVGVENLIIVDSTDALLVMDKNKSQEIKKVVQKIGIKYPNLGELHDTVYRPWGTYTVLESDEGFKLKKIVVYPGQSLSLQMHHHRSEHWIVVSGIAKVVNDNQEMFIRKNESTYIKAGHKHRLTNPGVIDCVLIEVQVGDYLEEDDIVRFDDVYGRK